MKLYEVFYDFISNRLSAIYLLTVIRETEKMLYGKYEPVHGGRGFGNFSIRKNDLGSVDKLISNGCIYRARVYAESPEEALTSAQPRIKAAINNQIKNLSFVESYVTHKR